MTNNYFDVESIVFDDASIIFDDGSIFFDDGLNDSHKFSICMATSQFSSNSLGKTVGSATKFTYSP